MRQNILIVILCFISSKTLQAQTQFYVSEIDFTQSELNNIKSSFVVSENNVILNAANYNLYSIRKQDGQINWQTYIGWKSNYPPYVYNQIIYYSSYENEKLSGTQFNLNNGEVIKKLLFESINTTPLIVNDLLYTTSLMDGGKLMAYNLKENTIRWQANIGHGVDAQPQYLKDRIIAKAEDDNWFEIDYQGNFLKTRSKMETYIDTNLVTVRKYLFLSHDQKEFKYDYLRKYKINTADYQTRITSHHTTILTDDQLLVFGNNKKLILQLELPTMLDGNTIYNNEYRSILNMDSKTIWILYHNNILHYDFRAKKLLKKIDVSKWNPHQLLIENRTIWLISKNDGQLYALDFEPDQKTADYISVKAEVERERNNPKQPDKKKIEAAKAAEEKFKN